MASPPKPRVCEIAALVMNLSIRLAIKPRGSECVRKKSPYIALDLIEIIVIMAKRGSTRTL